MIRKAFFLSIASLVALGSTASVAEACRHRHRGAPAYVPGCGANYCGGGYAMPAQRRHHHHRRHASCAPAPAPVCCVPMAPVCPPPPCVNPCPPVQVCGTAPSLYPMLANSSYQSFFDLVAEAPSRPTYASKFAAARAEAEKMAERTVKQQTYVSKFLTSTTNEVDDNF